MRSTPFPVTGRAGYLVKQLQHALRARMDNELSALGLSTGQYAILTAVEEAPGSSGAELARRCFITPQSVNGLLAGLQHSGLIERSASATHGRIVETTLSAQGRQQLRAAHKIVAGIENEMLRLLDEDQRREFTAFLKHCIDGLGN
jgi:DNA-binding MarR family transcriptional regulator